MSGYISGRDLIAYWNIESFEFFNCLKKGLQPYTSHGHKIIDTDTLEHGRERSLEQCIAEVRDTQKRRAVEFPGGRLDFFSRLNEQGIERQGRLDYEFQALKPLNPPPHHMSFTLPSNTDEASIVLYNLNFLLFKKDETSEFAEKQGLSTLDSAIEMPVAHKERGEGLTSSSPSVLDSTVAEKQPEYESFVRELKVFYENDSEIKTRSPGEPLKCLNLSILGFQNKEAVPWKDFLNNPSKP